MSCIKYEIRYTALVDNQDVWIIPRPWTNYRILSGKICYSFTAYNERRSIIILIWVTWCLIQIHAAWSPGPMFTKKLKTRIRLRIKLINCNNLMKNLVNLMILYYTFGRLKFKGYWNWRNVSFLKFWNINVDSDF